MKITVEAVPTTLNVNGGFVAENYIYLNDEFEGVLGYFGKIDFETDLVENKILIKNKKYEKKIKFTATKDVKFWILINSNTFRSSGLQIHYAGKDLNVIEIN